MLKLEQVKGSRKAQRRGKKNVPGSHPRSEYMSFTDCFALLCLLTSTMLIVAPRIV